MKRHILILAVLEVLLLVGSIYLFVSQSQSMLRYSGFLLMAVVIFGYPLVAAANERERGDPSVGNKLMLVSMSSLGFVFAIIYSLVRKEVPGVIIAGVGLFSLFASVVMYLRVPKRSGFQESLSNGSIAAVDDIQEGYYEEDQSAVDANAGKAGIRARIDRQQRIGSDGEILDDNTQFGTMVQLHDGTRVDAAWLAHHAVVDARANADQARQGEIDRLLKLIELYPNVPQYVEQLAAITGVSPEQLTQRIETKQNGLDIRGLIAQDAHRIARLRGRS